MALTPENASESLIHKMSDDDVERLSPTLAAEEAFGAKLFAALAKAQGETSNPPLDAVNPHYRSRFASLPAVRDAVIPPLAANGIAVIQNVSTSEGAVECQTVLVHSSGERYSFPPLRIPIPKDDAQGFGIAMTYARRYSLLAVGVVAGDEDEDGSVPVPTGAPRADAPAVSGRATAKQRDLIKKRAGTDERLAVALSKVGCDSLEELPFDKVNLVLEALQQ